MAITFGDRPLGGIYDQGNPPGTRADARPASYDTRTVQGTAIGYGQPVFIGTTSAHCTRTPAAGKFLGASVSRDVDGPGLSGSEPFAHLANDGYPENASCTFLQRGAIWVTAASAANPEDPAYITAAGLVTTVASGSTPIPARFESKLTGPGLAVLRVMA